MLALHIQLTKLQEPLGGLALFSGYLIYPLRQLIAAGENKSKLHLLCNLNSLAEAGRVFAWHGSDDDHFPAKTALELYSKLFHSLGAGGALKMQVEFPGAGHSPVPEQAFESMFAAMFATE
mmetsp:Transcript_20367/g.41431  ORF Transcript_20367/g.41431 Transcript_20367/m.41431 type:complete len:121 (+) Transcript_20367:2-364(+)